MKQHHMTYPSDIPEDPGFVLIIREIPAGTIFPIHWHDFLEFEIIVSGRGEHIYNGSAYTVTKDCAYLMCYNDFHGLTATTDMKLYSIHFSKSLLHPELADFLEFNKFRCRFTPAETEEIVQKLLQMDDELKNGLPFHDIIVKNLIADIMIRAIRKSTNEKIHEAPPPIQKAVAYINANFHQNLTLADLAREICFSPNYLGQLFKTETGMTFN
ncbi:MAG: AraC family ligand binding domain-containing protein, partial [Roseburia sp.]|nr:AraC family ligand binding domain-containing protein [Roseburia sp.]